MFQNYGKIEMESMTKKVTDIVDRSKISGVYKLGVLEGKNRNDV